MFGLGAGDPSSGCTYCSILNNVIYQPPSCGVRLGILNRYSLIEGNIIIEANSVRVANSAGILVEDGSDDWVVTGNVIYNTITQAATANEGNGIEVYQGAEADMPTRGIISNNLLISNGRHIGSADNQGNGIYVLAPSLLNVELTISGNIIYDSGTQGISISNVTGVCTPRCRWG